VREELLAAFHKSFEHHKQHPTQHGLRLFLANINLAMDIAEHMKTELNMLKALAEELLRQVEHEDNAVTAYEQQVL
jgi:hypothetical protein